MTIDDDLKITGRTVSGVTVPFDSLSGGTREQLSLMYRLSCSMIVVKDGGTPVILDDALGLYRPGAFEVDGRRIGGSRQGMSDCYLYLCS